MRESGVRRFSGVPNAALLGEAATCVRTGGTLIFPTDTVYGIGCDPENQHAVAAVFAAKRRPPDRPLSLHVARAEDALHLVADLPRAAHVLMEKFWPGPLTIIVRRAPHAIAAAALGGATIGLRCPDDDASHAILIATGPLAATSANISGETAYDGSDADVARLPEASLALLKGPTSLRRESTVLDCTGAMPKILRSGALRADTLRAALAGIAELET
jgi:tRNA threonylcarbamoyl adenosine modification protein (Sua5/YciO/YrdC/YwlC family)